MAKEAKKPSKKSNDLSGLWKIYGSRMAKSGERINISILRADSTDDKKIFGTITLPTEGTRNTKVKVKDFETIIRIPRLDVAESDDDDFEEDDED